MEFDTIAAIASGVTEAGISVIRISGPEAFSVAERIFFTKKGDEWMPFSTAEIPSHTVHYGFLREGNVLVDEVMLLLFRAPKTYTREDTVEIDCHGGIAVTRSILDLVCRNGARPAEPGEFTKRAFLNGRIDLSQAEAVIDLIQAKNALAVKNSLKQLTGRVFTQIEAIREALLHDVAFIEAAIDDPEHIDTTGFSETLAAHVWQHLREVERLLSTAEHGRMLKEGIRTVILGKPNAGKSSLLNALLGEERAIVTEIAGTTRDTLEEMLSCNGISLLLVDTAGIRATEDTVEQIGVARARAAAAEADLLLYVVDASVPLDENDRDIMEVCRAKKTVIVLNKSDLPACVSEAQIKEVFAAPVVTLSAKEQTGFTELETVITELFFAGELTHDDEVYITAARHKAALYEAKNSLLEVQNSLRANLPEDFYSIDLMNAYTKLGQIIGKETDEDLINKIFADFCMGK